MCLTPAPLLNTTVYLMVPLPCAFSPENSLTHSFSKVKEVRVFLMHHHHYQNNSVNTTSAFPLEWSAPTEYTLFFSDAKKNGESLHGSLSMLCTNPDLFFMSIPQFWIGHLWQRDSHLWSGSVSWQQWAGNSEALAPSLWMWVHLSVSPKTFCRI